jgi:hypothetical protein
VSRPMYLPPREPDDRRASGQTMENFARQQPLNLLQWLDSMERRIEALENRLARIHVDSG